MKKQFHQYEIKNKSISQKQTCICKSDGQILIQISINNEIVEQDDILADTFVKDFSPAAKTAVRKQFGGQREDLTLHTSYTTKTYKK